MSFFTTEEQVRGLIDGLHDMAFDTEKARDYLRPLHGDDPDHARGSCGCSRPATGS